ncbi:MAG TPA: branched-chain amino acid ABC transporter permease [Actinomycetota bacterium]|nr:branched-chain amino acid ABC transporter permease [Actinomycetota bacterium]
MRTAVVTAILFVIVAIVLAIGAGEQTGPNRFVVLGVVNGAVFGLMALGLVLVYKGTRVFNFMQGEFGTFGAYLLFIAIEDINMAYGFGIVFALAGVVVAGLMVERVIIRPLINSPRITVLVATIAIALLAVGIQILVFRIDPKALSPIMQTVDAAGVPQGLTVFELPIEPQRLIAVATLLSFGILLGWFFSRTDLGLAVLATSQDAFATRVVGIGVERMSRFIWGSAALLGGIAGLLYIPVAGALLPGVMSSNILIPAFTGAVIGGMTSLPGAFVGGVTIGLVQALSLWAAGHYFIGERALAEVIPGAEQLSILAVLLLVLLARPQGLLGTEA